MLNKWLFKLKKWFYWTFFGKLISNTAKPTGCTSVIIQKSEGIHPYFTEFKDYKRKNYGK